MVKNSFTYDDLIECAKGKLFGEGNAKLPAPPMLMMDRITKITKDGGNYNKGEIIAELDIKPNLWFFDCHFKNDPVMPGCLGLDGMWQLVGFFLTWGGGKGRGRALGVGDVKFKGQIRPYHTRVTYNIDIKRLLDRDGQLMVWADGTLTTNKGKTIYFAKNLQVGLFKSLTYDFGGDPSQDSF